MGRTIVSKADVMQAETDLAERIREAWNTPPWSCNLEPAQQMVLARIAAKTAIERG